MKLRKSLTVLHTEQQARFLFIKITNQSLPTHSSHRTQIVQVSDDHLVAISAIILPFE